jgi:N6-adenosine-specific RNA methylase IME4
MPESSPHSKRYSTIVVDPPWPMPSGGVYSGSGRWRKPPSALPYPVMSLAEITALPIDELRRRDSHLYLWVPNAFMTEAYPILEAWKYRPSQILVWAKTPRGIGLGGTFTNTTEFAIFARRGSLQALRRIDTTWFNWTRPHNNHSAKPEAFLDLVEQVSPGPYLELFARRNRLGWDTWGNEALEHVEVVA